MPCSAMALPDQVTSQRLSPTKYCPLLLFSGEIQWQCRGQKQVCGTVNLPGNREPYRLQGKSWSEMQK